LSPSEGILCCRSTIAYTPAADRPASDALVPASLPAAPRDLPAAAVEGEASAKRKFKAYPIGYFHIDIAEVRTAQGKLYLLVAINRTSKFAFIELHEKVARRTAGDFLRRLIAAVPYKVHTVLTDNGTHFTTPGNTSSAAPDIKAALDAGEPVWAHAFEYACAQNDIDHRLTKPNHPWILM
jgi:transposase InsO family protein